MPKPKDDIDLVNPPKVDVPKDKMYSEKEFRGVSDDMHKFKGMVKELTVTIEGMSNEKKEDARKALEKNEQYKELYETELANNESLKQKIEKKDNDFLNAEKLSAVKDKLGQFKKPKYDKFIDTSRIIMDNDGHVDETTVDNEVKRLKAEYPELIKVKSSSRLPDEAPESGEVIPTPLKKMTKEQRMDARLKLIEDRTKQQ